MGRWDSPLQEAAMDVVKEYDARVDTKHRLTIRGSRYEHYHVKEFSDGRIQLEPRVLVSPFEISKNTLQDMDESMANFESSHTSAPINLSEFSE